MDVSSISSNGQLLLFSGGSISYGLLSEVGVFSRDFTWLGNRRIDIAQLRAVLYSRWVWFEWVVVIKVLCSRWV